MTKPRTSRGQLRSTDTASPALSPAAGALSEALARWRVRITETQTLVRLILSLLKGVHEVGDERREQLGRLVGIEARAFAQMPRLDLWSLRSTTNARESGMDLRGPDCGAAERFLDALVESVGRQLRAVARALTLAPDAVPTMLDLVSGTLDDLARQVDLLDATLHPRLNDPSITVREAFARAAAQRGQSVTVEGDTDTALNRVRGMMRLLSELIASVGGDAYVHTKRDGNWLDVSIAPLATGHADVKVSGERAELLRLAAYLLRMRAERIEGGGWRLSVMVRDKSGTIHGAL